MKTFNNFSAFTKHMRKVLDSYELKELEAGNLFAELLEKAAKDKIGHLMPGAGPFAAWPELADSTKADKERQGYAFNAEYNPLYRTGEMRDSIEGRYYPKLKKVLLASADDKMLWHEEGTVHIPARSTLGLTMFQSKELAWSVFGQFLRNWTADAPIKISIRAKNYV